jgi:small subunit ribosomal protein S17
MNKRRRLVGVVTSNKMQKTVVVEVSRTFRHPLYLKVVHSSKRMMAHDEQGCQIGDQVRIVESRPLSRHKKWVVEEILHRDIRAGEALPEAEVETLPEAEVEAQPEAEVEAQPEAEVEAQPEAEVETLPEAEVEAQPETPPEAQP